MADYRQQSAGALVPGVSTCPSCYIPIQLYYSNVDATDVCCNVNSTTTFYLAPGTNPATLANASAIYSDDQGTPAADGFYRE